jgi:D-alanine--poly(phosphoribitol) ligase subunit 2
MELETIRSALHDYILGDILLRKAPLGSDEDLFDAGFDSMSLTRVLVFVEQRFGVTIPDQEVVVEEVATLDSLSRFVAAWVAKAGK